MPSVGIVSMSRYIFYYHFNCGLITNTINKLQIKKVVVWGGFEPPTQAFSGLCSCKMAQGHFTKNLKQPTVISLFFLTIILTLTGFQRQ